MGEKKSPNYSTIFSTSYMCIGSDCLCYRYTGLFTPHLPRVDQIIVERKTPKCSEAEELCYTHCSCDPL